MTTTEAPVLLDFRGLRCPLPVLKARKALADLAPGTRVEIHATDPMAAVDIPHLCREDGHRLVGRDSDGLVLRFRIDRGPTAPSAQP